MKSTNQSESLLLSRVEKLERQNRWMRSGLMCVLLGGAGIVLLAAKAADEDKTIEATQIILRDEDGNKRVVLGHDTHPNWDGPRTGVFVYDAKGDASVNLVAADGGASMSVEDEGNLRLSLGSGKKRYAGLIVLAHAGQSEKGQMCFFYTDEGKPAFALNDSNHQTRIMMMLDRGEKPHLMLQDENQKAFYSRGQP